MGGCVTNFLSDVRCLLANDEFAVASAFSVCLLAMMILCQLSACLDDPVWLKNWSCHRTTDLSSSAGGRPSSHAAKATFSS